MSEPTYERAGDPKTAQRELLGNLMARSGMSEDKMIEFVKGLPETRVAYTAAINEFLAGEENANDKLLAQLGIEWPKDGGDTAPEGDRVPEGDLVGDLAPHAEKIAA